MYYPSAGTAKLTVESYDGYEGLDETMELTSLVEGAYIEASNENVKVRDNSVLFFALFVIKIFVTSDEGSSLNKNKIAYS